MFVGRRQELEAFERNLQLPLDHPQRSFVIGVSGQAGMGKTTFLQRCRAIAEANNAVTAWSDQKDLDLLDVMSSLARSVEADSDFREFNEKLRKYRDLRNKLEQADQSSKIAGTVAAAAGRAGVRLARRLPAAGIAFDYLDEDEVAAHVGEAAAFVVRQFTDRDDAELLLGPIDSIAPAFVDGLSKAMRNRPVALFFDTFEETGHFVEPWIIALLEGNYGDFPQNIMLLIGGRPRLGSNAWAPFESILEFVELGPLEDDDARSYLSRKGISDPQQIDELVRMARGLPIHLVSLAVGDPRDPQAGDTVVERVLRSVSSSVREASIKGAIPRAINRDLLLTLDIPDELFDQLLELPFVEPSVGGWVFHPVIRAEFLDHGWRESPKTLVDLHLQLAKYHKDLMQRESARDNSLEMADHGREMIYHEASVEYSATLGPAIAGAIRVWNISVGEARQYASALRDAEVDRQMGSDRQWGRRLIVAIDAHEEGNTQPGIEFMSAVLDSGFISSAKGRVAALLARAELRADQGVLPAAAEDLDEALNLDSSNWELYFRRALILIDARDYEAALRDCERALDYIAPDNRQKSLLNVFYVRIAKEILSTEEALELINGVLEDEVHPRGLIIRASLRRDAGDTDGSIDDLRHAQSLDPGRQHEVAKEMGITHRQSNDPESAQRSFVRALEAEPKCDHCWRQLAQVLVELGDSTDVTEELRDLAREVPGIGMYRGRALLGVGEVDAAVRELEQAVREEPANPDCRVRLSQAFLYRDDLESALGQAEEALALQPNWPSALALRGDIRYHLDRYRGAEEDWSSYDELTGGRGTAAPPERRGLCLSKLGEYDRAVEQFHRALEVAPDVDVLYNLAIAEACRQGGRPERREQSLREATSALAEPNVLPVVRLYGRAGLEAVAGDEEKAKAGLTAAISEDAEKVTSWARTDPAWQRYRDTEWFINAVRADG